MADVLNFQTGLRVEETCSNCGVPQIRINGLEGQYTQILMDSRPIFSSLASVYGLEQLPAGMVDRIEVIRGGGSALYGANAIAGVVNIILLRSLHVISLILAILLLLQSKEHTTSIQPSTQVWFQRTKRQACSCLAYNATVNSMTAMMMAIRISLCSIVPRSVFVRSSRHRIIPRLRRSTIILPNIVVEDMVLIVSSHMSLLSVSNFAIISMLLLLVGYVHR